MAAIGLVLVLLGCTSGSPPPPTARTASSSSVARSATASTGDPVSVRPSPLISRGKPTFASPDVNRVGADAVVDGQYCTYPAWRTNAFPTWLAIKVGAGPTRLLLSWNNGYTYNYIDDTSVTTYGIPASYTIEASADSTNGADGMWQQVADIRDNSARTRAHSFTFAGASWVRMTVTGVVPGTREDTLAINEIDIHDASAGTEDTVFFVGDSITAAAFDRCDQKQPPPYADLVHAQFPDHFPAIINGGVGGVNSAYGAKVIGNWLAVNHDYRLWAIGYGTNDAWQSVPPAVFEAQLQAIIDAVVATGRQPVLARIPYAIKGPKDENVRALNEVIDRLTARNHLPSGPDLYSWFSSHPHELSADGVHPTKTGSASINRLWYEALRPLYQTGAHSR